MGLRVLNWCINRATHPEVSSEGVASSVVGVSDQWFAPAQSLLKPNVSEFALGLRLAHL